MSFRPAHVRYDSQLEALKRRFSYLLRRDLTAKEQLWLELSAPILPRLEEDETLENVELRTAA